MSTATQTAPWQCQACFEDHNTSPVVLADSSICEDCFLEGYKPQFEQALKDQTKYPVKWGPTPLDIDAYSRFFSADFLAKWRTKMKEYTVPVKQRIYCDQQVFTIPDDDLSAPTEDICGTFLGSIIDNSNKKTIRCFACHSDFDISKFAEASSMELLEGQVRGKDYQLCPNETCGTVMTLEDGCNEVVCDLCNTTVCYLCGKMPERGHWAFGQPCPRFGNHDSANPIHDDDGSADLTDNAMEPRGDAHFPTEDTMALAHPTITLTRVEEQRIFTSGVGELLMADRQRLVILRHSASHDRLFIPRTILEIVALIDRLNEASELYIAHLATVLPFDGSWQSNWQKRWQHLDIGRLADSIGVQVIRALPGLGDLIETHNHAWNGDIEARAEALAAAENNALVTSRDWQRLAEDRDHLQATHARWLDSPMGGMAMEAAHRLTHLLEVEIQQIYVGHLYQTDILLGWRPQQSFGHRTHARAEIRTEYRNMITSVAVVTAFPELQNIYFRYHLAWNSLQDVVRASHPEDPIWGMD